MELTVGARLKKLRLEKGLSLEEVHKRTKVHLNILRAIEEDSLLDFSPVYKKGFLKIYSKFLGLDPQECIPDYKEPSSRVEYVSGFSSKPFLSLKASLGKLSSLKVLRMKPKDILVTGLIVIFIIALFNVGKIVSLKRGIAPRKAKLPVAASVSPKMDKNQMAKADVPAAPKIIKLDIYAKESCFIQLKADGKVIFQNILRKGRSESWQAMHKIELSLGNAGAVELEVNGKRMSSLGRRGQAIKNILITKEGLSIKQ